MAESAKIKFNGCASRLTSVFYRTISHRRDIPFLISQKKMLDIPLIACASRVEAAVKCYLEVRDFADEKVWREHLLEEKVSTLFGQPLGVRFDPHFL